MKILLLSDGIVPYSLGGIQRHSQLLLRYFLEQGHELYLFYALEKEKNASALELLKHSGIENPEKYLPKLRIKAFDFPTGDKLPGHYMRASKSFSKQLFEAYTSLNESFDFIYAQGFCSWYFAERMEEVKDKLAVNFHGFEMYQKATGWKGQLKNRMLRAPVRAHLNKHVWWLSLGKGISKIILSLGVRPEQIIENPSGIDADWLRPKQAIKSPEKAIRFLFVGRYERRKGIEEIKAAIENIPDIHFDFVGPIPKHLQVKAAHVQYHGVVNDKQALISIMDACHVLVAPSYSEGLPNVIMEAMARGLAIVCTDVGANSSIARPENAFYVRPGNVQDLKECLMAIQSSPKERIFEKALLSREIIEDFVWPKPVIELIESIDASSS